MSRASRILIVDDDVDYASLLQIAFQEAGVGNPIEVFHDGGEAVDYLSKPVPSDQHLPEDVPALVLLDLKLPRLNGLEVLRWIRQQPRLASVPVLLFTGAETETTESHAIELGAAALRVKPFSYRELMGEVERIRDGYLEPRQLSKAA